MPRVLDAGTRKKMQRRKSSGNPSSKAGRQSVPFEEQFRGRLVAMRDEFRRQRALVDGGTVCDDALALFDEYLAARDQVVVTPVEGELISGYHREHLTRLVREGKISDLRPKGSKGRISIRLSELPRKPGHAQTDMPEVNEIAERIFRSKRKP